MGATDLIETGPEGPAPEVLRRRHRLLLIVAVVVVVAVGGITAGVVTRGSPSSSTDTKAATIVSGALEVGKPAPDFDVPGLRGGRVKLSAFRGHPVVLTFFASWCHPCEKEQPILRAGLEKYGKRGLRVVGITYQDADPDARAFAQRLDATWPLGTDADGDVARAYRVRAIPLTYFIEPDGKVASLVFGLRSSDELDANVAKILPRR
ncbi:MAG: TlpA disulfide reductase family protein [Acidimicrobiia bacterium]